MLSAKGILLKRDTYTREPIDFKDDNLLKYKHDQRIKNHKHSELSKSRGHPALPIPNFAVGHIVHVKSDGSKHLVRDHYIIESIDYKKDEAFIKKLGRNQFRSKSYGVKLQDIYPAVNLIPPASLDDAESDDDIDLRKYPAHDESGTSTLRRSDRNRKTPEWLSPKEIERT